MVTIRMPHSFWFTAKIRAHQKGTTLNAAFILGGAAFLGIKPPIQVSFKNQESESV